MDKPQQLHVDDFEGASMAQYEATASVKTPSRRATASRNSTKSKYSGGQTGELDNIAKGVSPYQSEDDSCLSVATQIELMQKAYYNIAAVRSAIDVMTDLSNSKIKFVGENKSAVKFFTAWEKKINNWDFRSRFFREYFRSSNVFIYKFEGELTYSDFRKSTRANVSKKIPVRYVILNPKDIKCNGGVSFINATYSKVLNEYEAKRLQNPVTQEEQDFVQTLDPAAREELKKGGQPSIFLKQENLTAIFNGKQDYEPLVVPCFFSVLQDCNFKIELRKSEMILARSCDKFLLLITCGDKDRDMSLNEKLRLGITQLFAQESIGRVLVSDYSTEADFIIPDFSKIFGIDKYKAVNEDIANSLMNIFWKDESFSSSMIKIQIFLERLKTAREAYINLFLRPEMEKIAKDLGFQDVPEIRWEDFALKDDLEYKKLYVRLCELGVMTPDETFEAFQTHQLPSPEDSVNSQKDFKKLKEQELYEPLMGKPKEDAGRPLGSKAPKKKIKVSPVGASEGKFSLAKISENVKSINSISLLIEEAYKEKHNISRLSKKHKEITWNITSSLVTNESKEQWESKIAEYLIQAKDIGEKTDEIFYLAAEHNVDPVVGAILYNSQIEE